MFYKVYRDRDVIRSKDTASLRRIFISLLKVKPIEYNDLLLLNSMADPGGTINGTLTNYYVMLFSCVRSLGLIILNNISDDGLHLSACQDGVSFTQYRHRECFEVQIDKNVIDAFNYYLAHNDDTFLQDLVRDANIKQIENEIEHTEKRIIKYQKYIESSKTKLEQLKLTLNEHNNRDQKNNTTGNVA